MKHYDDISILVDRFLDGETSLAEERMLNEFFMSHESKLGEMSEHLQIAAEMFRELRAMSSKSIVGSSNVHANSKRPFIFNWMKWAVAIAVACLALCLVLFSPNETKPRLEEQPLQVAELTLISQTDTINANQSENIQPDNLIVEAPKNKPVKRQSKSVYTKSEQENITSSPKADEINYGETLQPGNVMLCGFNPSANMLPIHSDVTTRSVISECEMAILEEEFQKSERKRHTIEI